MFRIGDFSKIARVSARLLRFYDETGLFTPAHADPRTGYRYYTVGQLAQLNRILVLKDLGFNLDQVRDILSSNVGATELRNMLLLRRNDVEQTLAAESQRLHRIETRIAQLESEGTLSADDVVVRVSGAPSSIVINIGPPPAPGEPDPADHAIAVTPPKPDPELAAMLALAESRGQPMPRRRSEP